MDAKIHDILKNLPDLPDSTVVPVAVAAAHDGVSQRTVRRRYPRVPLTDRLYGIRLGFLRSGRNAVAS